MAGLHYRMAITSVLYNECLWRRCLTKKGNVAQVELYNINKQRDYILDPSFSVSDDASGMILSVRHDFIGH